MNKNVKVNSEQVSNAGKVTIEAGEPYIATVTIEGSADLLFHRWNVDGVEAKGKAAKGSKAKKSDNVESYVYRNAEGEVCLPGEYLRQSILGAAKFRQDPRSPRKSAQDLYKAAIVSLTPLASFGKTDWDYLDKRRVMVQRAGITRVRPAMLAGWRLTFEFQIILAEYLDPITFRQAIEEAGRLIGLADFRPTFGRFGIIAYDVR
jgi:hypothetical protein